jgi:hypothetical protein
MSFDALWSAALYTALGLGVFFAAVKVLRTPAPAEMPDAVVRAAAILGAAWIIAATLH